MSAALPGDMEIHDEGHGYDAFGLHLPTLARALSIGGAACDTYFRTRSDGIEHIPPMGPAILVANHGGVLPIDGLLLGLDIDRHTDRVLRPIADRFVPSLPVVGTILARCGAVVGTHANVDQLLERGELVAIWPEGSRGIAKPPSKRYRFETWRVGHAELALRHRVPVIPVAILGPEEAWPALGRIPLPRRLHVPFLPVPALPLPLPLRHYITYGVPIYLHEGQPEDADRDPVAVGAAALRVRLALVELIRNARMQRAGRYW